MKVRRFFLSLTLGVICAGCGTIPRHPVGGQVKFLGPEGDAIILDTEQGDFIGPRGQRTRLIDCSKDDEFCYTNGNGFALASYRKCGDVVLKGLDGLRFSPKVIWVLHSHSWIIFEEAPGYLYHFVEGRGFVGILVSLSGSTDLRTLLIKPALDPDPDLIEYKIDGSSALAPCT